MAVRTRATLSNPDCHNPISLSARSVGAGRYWARESVRRSVYVRVSSTGKNRNEPVWG